jgi:hypothetical protein
MASQYRKLLLNSACGFVAVMERADRTFFPVERSANAGLTNDYRG